MMLKAAGVVLAVGAISAVAALPMPYESPAGDGSAVVPSYRSPSGTLLQRNRNKRDQLVGPANVLFLMCDSMDGRVLDPTSPVYERLEMPNLRKLAASGVNFVKMYASSPQCVPSRTTMLAGRRTDHIEAWSNSQALPAAPDGTLDPACVSAYSKEQCASWAPASDLKSTFVDAMEAVGCEVCLYGKVDIGADLIERKNEANATVVGYHGGPTMSITGRSADIRKPTKPDPVSITRDNDNNVHPEDWKMVDKCLEWLQDHKPFDPARDSATDYKTWMLYCSVNIPHPAFQTNATWLAMVHDDKIPLPPWGNKDEYHPADSFMSISKAVWRDFTEEEILTVRKTYYAMCAETDYLLGRVYNLAEATGHVKNTYTIFLSDHGEMNMEHRQVWKNSLYEPSARVPFIVSGPGVSAGKMVTDTITSLLDVYPTLVDMVGGTAPAYLDGYSLMPLLNPSHPRSIDVDAGARPDYITMQYHSNMGNTGSFAIRQGDWKYIAFGTNLKAFADYRPQLFNVKTDPDEQHDLASVNTSVARQLDGLLRSEFDYTEVDLKVKTNDKMIYQKFFVEPAAGNETVLRAHWEKAYRGFDDADWAKAKAWAAEQLPPLKTQ